MPGETTNLAGNENEAASPSTTTLATVATFLDTPGQEIFYRMRTNGARVADAVVLVVSGMCIVVVPRLCHTPEYLLAAQCNRLFVCSRWLKKCVVFWSWPLSLRCASGNQRINKRRDRVLVVL